MPVPAKAPIVRDGDESSCAPAALRLATRAVDVLPS